MRFSGVLGEGRHGWRGKGGKLRLVRWFLVYVPGFVIDRAGLSGLLPTKGLSAGLGDGCQSSLDAANPGVNGGFMFLVDCFEVVCFSGNGNFEGLIADTDVGSRSSGGFGFVVLFLGEVRKRIIIKGIGSVYHGLVQRPG